MILSIKFIYNLSTFVKLNTSLGNSFISLSSKYLYMYLNKFYLYNIINVLLINIKKLIIISYYHNIVYR